MNNFDAFRGISRRHFFDDYRSPLTCVEFPETSGSSSGETIDIDFTPVVQAGGPGPLTAVAAGLEVTLDWPRLEDAYAYVVYRATAAEGPYLALVTGLIPTSWVDIVAVSGTYYYKVTAIEPAFGETAPSNVVTVTV